MIEKNGNKDVEKVTKKRSMELNLSNKIIMNLKIIKKIMKAIMTKKSLK